MPGAIRLTLPVMSILLCAPAIPGNEPTLVCTLAIFALMKRVDEDWRIDTFRIYLMETCQT